jgi:hypothetical protein
LPISKESRESKETTQPSNNFKSAQSKNDENEEMNDTYPTSQMNNNREVKIFGDINRHSVGLGLGQTILFGDLKDNGDNQITVDAFYSYSASYSFDLLANFHLSKHKFREQSVTIPGVAVGIKGKIFQFDNFSPFVLGGLGFYHPTVERFSENQITKSEGKWTFGTHLGFGVDLKLNDQFVFGIFTHYHNPFDIKQEIGPEVEGSYSKFLITTMYSF